MSQSIKQSYSQTWMPGIKKVLGNRVFQHICYWFLAIILIIPILQEDSDIIEYKKIVVVIIFWAIPLYFHYFLVLPYLFQGKFGRYFLYLLPTIIVFGALEAYFSFHFLDDDLGFQLAQHTLNVGVMIALVTGIAFIKNYITQRRVQQERELQLLKAQLNPHFLFNTLNNLYGLAVVKSDDLPDLMLKLSDLLRYMLYEANEPWVPLEKEIQYIKNYLHLESIRLGNRADIYFDCQGNFQEKKIAPMILITFVENAFKHLSAGIKEKAFVNIRIQLRGKQLTLFVENSKDPIPSQNIVETKKKKGGIGIQNLKQRLRLLYLSRYNLNIVDGETVYKVDLKLMLE